MTDTSKELVLASNAYSRAGLTERQQYIRMLAAAGNLLPQHLRGAGNVGDPGKAFLLAETGDMLGIHPMAAVVGVHIIEGRPSLSANLMTGLVRKAGHILRVWVDGKIEDKTLAAHAELIRSDDPDFTFRVDWTLKDAERALLYPGKAGSNWQKYTRAMLKSRVTSEIIREGASDVLMGGNVYTPEELGVQVDEQGDPIVMTQVRDEPKVAPQAGSGVSRETPLPETPITEPEVPQTGAESPAEGEAPAAAFDYAAALRDAKSRDEVSDLYQRARAEGALTTKIKVGRKQVELGQAIIDIGTKMKELEEAAAAGGIEGDEASDVLQGGGAAVLGEDVVDAEIVEDEPSDEDLAYDPVTGEIRE